MSKYKLSDDCVFKPTGRKMTPEEEKRFELFLDVLAEKGTASVDDPLDIRFPKPAKPLSEALKDGSARITFNDANGEMSFEEIHKKALNGDYDGRH